MRENLRHQAKTWEDSLIVLPGQQRPAKKKRSEVFKMLKWQLPELVKKPAPAPTREQLIEAIEQPIPQPVRQPVLQDEPDNDFWEQD